MSVHPNKSLEDQSSHKCNLILTQDSEMYNRRKFKYVNDKAAICVKYLIWGYTATLLVSYLRLD